MSNEEFASIKSDIADILGLESFQGDDNMLLTRNEDNEVTEGICFEEEVVEITRYIEDLLLSKSL